jgi:hypothetical protein
MTSRRRLSQSIFHVWNVLLKRKLDLIAAALNAPALARTGLDLGAAWSNKAWPCENAASV